MSSLSEKVRDLYLEGKSTSEIVKITNLVKTTVVTYLKNFGVFIPNRDIGIKVYCYDLDKIFENKIKCCEEMNFDYCGFCKVSKDTKEDYYYKNYRFNNIVGKS